MSVISMKQLLEAGVHFGHQTRRWNPKMAPYIYTERNGIYIIDLQKSVGMVDDAYQAIADIAANGGTVLFVGTKKQAQDAIKNRSRALWNVLCKMRDGLEVCLQTSRQSRAVLRDSKTSRQCQKTEHSMYCQRKKLLS
mgnify:CR=1 FL=1